MRGPLIESAGSYDDREHAVSRPRTAYPGRKGFHWPVCKAKLCEVSQGSRMCLVWSLTSCVGALDPRDQTMTAGNRKALRTEKAAKT